MLPWSAPTNGMDGTTRDWGSIMSVSYQRVLATMTASALIVIGVDYATLAATGRASSWAGTTPPTRPPRLHQASPRAGIGVEVHRKRQAIAAGRLIRAGAVAQRRPGRRLARLGRLTFSRAVTYRVGRRGKVVAGIGVWSLDIKPGLYQVTFNVVAIPDTSPDLVGGMICGVVDLDTLGPNTRVYAADSGNVMDGDTGNPIAMSGAEMVRIGRTANPALYCGSNTSAYTLFSASVSLTKITSRTIKKAQPAPVRFRAEAMTAVLKPAR